VFFGFRGIVHHEFAPKAQTMNAAIYCNVLRRLTKDIWQKLPELWHTGNWLLHDDSAPSHPQQRYTSASTLLTRFGPLRLLPLSEDEAAAKESPFRQGGGDPVGIAECSWYASRTGLTACVPAVATVLGSMCLCTGDYFEGGAAQT
jgi:hypothetical protein